MILCTVDDEIFILHIEEHYSGIVIQLVDSVFFSDW